MPTIFWIAGENSGDLHASYVIEALNQSTYNYQHTGIGGYQMQTKGLKALFPFNRFNVMGFTEVIKHLSFFRDVEKKIRKIFETQKPDLVVLVDYPGLNLRIAKMAYDFNIPVFYYISPQFWAWKHHRVKQLSDYTKKVACILPFEPELLHIHRVEAEYVGHPIVEEIKIDISKEDFYKNFNLDPQKKVISFFPGSRLNEVEKLLPIYLNTIKLMNQDQYQFMISRASTIKESTFYELVNRHFNDISKLKIVSSNNYEMMKHSDFLVLKSGTSTLEAAYIGTPFVICYKANPLSYLIGKNIVKIKYIGLPNILLDQALIPELIQQDVNPKNIKSHIEKALNNTNLYESQKKEMEQIKKILGNKTASTECAKLIVTLINEK